MKRTLAVAVVLLSMVSGARADDASKKAKVEELFSVMHIDRLSDQTMTAVMGQVSTMISGMPGMEQATPAQKQILAEMQEKTAAMVRETMGWRALEPDMVQLYVATYSEEEIDGILAFYKSPVGQKMVEKTPALTTASMKIAQGKMVELQPRLRQLMEEYTRKLQDAAPKSAAAPGTGAGER